MSWLSAVFAFDRWLLAIVVGVGIVAAGIASTAFLAGSGRDPVLIPALQAPSDIGAPAAGRDEPEGRGAAAGEDGAGDEEQADGAPPPATELANRADCDAIRGSEYKSDVERLWFLQNCLSVPEEVAYTAGVGGPGPGVIVEPLGPDGEVLPTPATPFGATEATWAVADWLVAKGYSVVPGSCTAGQSGGNQWQVTCLAQETGCKVDCSAALSTCLISEPRTIWTC